METWLKILLLLYVAAFFALAFAWRSYLVWRRTGINPYALGSGDNTHDFVGKLFRLTMLALAGSVLLYALVPRGLDWLVPIFWLAHPVLGLAGALLLGLALAWVLIAQAQMGASWRIGIDDRTPASLVQAGLFGISRNPIFLGMIVMLLGLVAVLPTAVTLTIAVVGLVLIHIQVRLEEDHLASTYGPAYHAYRARVRRWL